MNPSAQRIAIAEACGWKWKPELFGLIQGPEHLSGARNVPDYPNDLNAMHEAEKVLTEKQWDSYINWELRCTVAAAQDRTIKCSVRPMPDEVRGLVHATAAQRAEAFLKATGRWEDDEQS